MARHVTIQCCHHLYILSLLAKVYWKGHYCISSWDWQTNCVEIQLTKCFSSSCFNTKGYLHRSDQPILKAFYSCRAFFSYSLKIKFITLKHLKLEQDFLSLSVECQNIYQHLVRRKLLTFKETIESRSSTNCSFIF